MGSLYFALSPGCVSKMSGSENISYLPSDGLSYDPAERLYWDKEALDKEMTRAIEICHGCRMCFKYCDAFPNLFKAIDDRLLEAGPVALVRRAFPHLMPAKPISLAGVEAHTGGGVGCRGVGAVVTVC